MYEVVVYDGVVLGKRAVREADVLVDIFTPQGLVRAKAMSARSEKSKLRYGLEPLSRARISLVRGKHEWRLVGVEAVSRRYVTAPTAGRQAIARVARLLSRLVHGQEPGAQLHAAVIEGFDALAGATQPEAVEVVAVLRILSHLGYLPYTPALQPFIDSEFSVELSAKALESRALLVRTINESLQATGL